MARSSYSGAPPPCCHSQRRTAATTNVRVSIAVAVAAIVFAAKRPRAALIPAHNRDRSGAAPYLATSHSAASAEALGSPSATASAAASLPRAAFLASSLSPTTGASHPRPASTLSTREPPPPGPTSSSRADADDYLQEGFDPRSVTIPRLRSILVTHNVDFPSTAKKPQLVELVTDHVLSQAPKLRAQRARAKRSSYGIVNAYSAEDTKTWDDLELPTPRSAPRRSGSPRKSSARIKVEGHEAEPSQLRSVRKRSSQSTSRQPSHSAAAAAPAPVSDDVDDDKYNAAADVSRPARRTRRTVTPQIRVESEEEGEQPPQEEESVFTDDNPFQSGSSPPAVKSPTNRRRTTGEDILKSTKTSRRRTDDVADQIKAGRSLEIPAPRLRSDTPEALLEPGEEFTPDEQLELERAASRGELTIFPRKTAPETSRQTSLKTPLFVLLLALLSAYGAWYRQEKIAVGYCGLGRPAKELLPPQVPIPDFLLAFVEPQCEQCPQHAYCYQDFSVRCEPGFILRPHPLSLGGLVPLSPSCEPDGEKARRVQAVADKAVEELRERRAKFECGNLVDESGQQEVSPAIDEQDLKESVSRKRSKRLNRQEFEDLWAAAIGEVTAREEVVVEVENTHYRSNLSDRSTNQSRHTTHRTSEPSHVSSRRIASTSLARLPLACAIKRSFWLGLARYRFPIGLLILVVLAISYLRARYRRHLATSAQIPALVDSVLGRLANQKELGEEDLDDAWLFLPNLRDDVLRSVHSLSERERIWQRVKAVVEQNSNVRTSQREGRSGEVGRAWEWIGPVKGEGARRRRSGRVSWARGATSESPEAGGMTETRKWEEPRPYY